MYVLADMGGFTVQLAPPTFRYLHVATSYTINRWHSVLIEYLMYLTYVYSHLLCFVVAIDC